MISLRTYRLIAAITVAAAVTPVLASAATQDPGVAVVSLSTSGVDLATEGGVAAMKQRIRAASKTVCQQVFAPDTSSDAVRDCRIEAAREAMPALQSAVRLAEATRDGTVQMSVNER